jgi:hypothetical protein
MGAQSCLVGACLVTLVGCGRDVRVEDDDGAGGEAPSTTTTTASLTCGVSDEDLLTCEGVCTAGSPCRDKDYCLGSCGGFRFAPECRAEVLAMTKCAYRSCGCEVVYCHDEIMAFQDCEEAHPQ